MAKTVNISSLIYGVNFPTSASYIKDLGVTISRWGGNAVTPYNPFGGFTNAGTNSSLFRMNILCRANGRLIHNSLGNDWYFENRVVDNGQADDWSGWVQAAGSKVLLTIPAYVNPFLVVNRKLRSSVRKQARLGCQGRYVLFISCDGIPWYVKYT